MELSPPWGAPRPSLARRPWPTWLSVGGLWAMQTAFALFLLLFLALPLLAILGRGLRADDGAGQGWTLWSRVLLEPDFGAMIARSAAVGVATVLLVLPCAYGFAYGLTRCRLPGKSWLRMLALLPLLAPSLLPGIALVYLGGNQGLLKPWLGGATVYGYWGIVLGEAFYTFPHALMILLAGLSLADGRLYDAARAMGAGAGRIFFTVTLPGTRYAVFSAACLVFTLAVTDFGVPKVVGGDYHVLAMQAYKAVVGQQDFSRGALIGLLLLVPALLSFALERRVRARQTARIDGRAQWHRIAAQPGRDVFFMAWMLLVSAAIALLVGVAVWASFVKMWPYQLSLSWRSYDFDNMDGGGWLAWRNSLALAFCSALLGTLVVFVGAWIMDKAPLRGAADSALRGLLRMLALLPMAVPGLVLGLGYIFFFNHPGNPLSLLYGSLPLLVACTIVHFYSSAHLTASTALKNLDPELEAAAATLKAPAVRTFLRVTLPLCLPVALEVARYLFVSAMTTVSAVVFLYSPQTVLAAVAVLNMDDAGFIGSAAAMCSLIMLSSALAAGLLRLASRAALARAQSWRQAAAD